MVEQITRAKNDIFSWPIIGLLFKNKKALFAVRTFVMLLFISAIYFGYAYPSLQENPYTTAVFWSLFWPFFMIVSLIFIGPGFCGICPHGVMGRYIYKFSLKKAVPKWMQNRGIGLGILLVAYWIPVYVFPELLKTPYIAAMLFFTLTVFAILSFYIFKDMAYCTYLCPIGAVTKGYGKIAMAELRTYQSACSECKTFDCALACKSNLQPFLFEKKNSMRDCTLCMECANACDAVSFNVVTPGRTLSKNINDKSTTHTWVFILLLAVITITMKLHHGLGHSPLKTSLPWYKMGMWIESVMPIGVDWVGFSALVMSLGITFVLIFGGFFIAAKVINVEFKKYLHSLSYALIPLMIIGSISHIGTFFFVSYASNFANAFYWLIGSDTLIKPIASFRDAWVHIFALFNFFAIIWSEILIYKRVTLFTSSVKLKFLATLWSSLIVYFLLFLALL